MTTVDEDTGYELTLNPEQVCYIIVKAREFDEKVAPEEGDAASNATDDKDVVVLEDYEDDPTLQELVSAIESLDDDSQNELVAMLWLGRGDYTLAEWDDAVRQAGEMRDKHVPTYLVGTPMLGDLLEEGWAQLGRSCEREELGRL